MVDLQIPNALEINVPELFTMACVRTGAGTYSLRGYMNGVLAGSVNDACLDTGGNHIDLYWMHVWDRTTQPEEVLHSLTREVQAGRILYYGFTNTPAWYVSRVAALAEARGLPGPVGLQYGWSLIERGGELDPVPMAQALGLGLVPWSPLAAGMLTGKYGREMLARADRAVSLPDKTASAARSGDGRLNGDNPYGGMLFTERNFAIVDTLRAVAEEIGCPMAQVALAWLAAQPAMGSILIGASRPGQLRENVAALEITLSADQKARLDTISALPLLNPYFIFDQPRERLFGGQSVTPW